MRKNIILLVIGIIIYISMYIYLFNIAEINFEKKREIIKNRFNVYSSQDVKRKYLPTYWPLPTTINLEPRKHIKDGQETKFDFGSQENRDHALLIGREDVKERKNQFIWISNDNKRLRTITQEHEQLLKMENLLKMYDDKADLSFISSKFYSLPVLLHKGKISIFEAIDDSGVVIIKHDGGVMVCGDMAGYNGYYWEIRFDSQEIFQGGIAYFPPKPEGWCRPYTF